MRFSSSAANFGTHTHRQIKSNKVAGSNKVLNRSDKSRTRYDDKSVRHVGMDVITDRKRL